jgi:hypothetical protein
MYIPNDKVYIFFDVLTHEILPKPDAHATRFAVVANHGDCLDAMISQCVYPRRPFTRHSPKETKTHGRLSDKAVFCLTFCE